MTKRIVSFNIDTDLDDELERFAAIIGTKSEIMEKALRKLFDDPEFKRAVSNIERALRENPEAKAK